MSLEGEFQKRTEEDVTRVSRKKKSVPGANELGEHSVKHRDPGSFTVGLLRALNMVVSPGYANVQTSYNFN